MSIDELEEFGCGTYTLIMKLNKGVRLKVGSLGVLDFPAGFYSYTGSALGPSRRAIYFRVKRHLSRCKKLKWHVDYFTSNSSLRVLAVIVSSGVKKMECEVSSLLSSFSGVVTFCKFGATDCKSNKCIGHLHFYLSKDFDRILSLIRNTYCSLNLNHKILFFEKIDY